MFNYLIAIITKRKKAVECAPEVDKCRRDRMEWADGCEIMLYRTGGLRRSKQLVNVLSHSNDGHISTAKITSDRDNLLPRKSYHTLYGVYPASAFHASNRKVAVSGDIPAVQKLRQNPDNPRHYNADLASHGYMYAISSPRLGDRPDMLKFMPLVTSYVFKLHSPADNYIEHKLKCVTLISEQDGTFLSGAFKAWLDSETGNHIPVTGDNIINGSNSVSAYFEYGIELGKGPEETTIINFVTVPMDHTKLKLTLEFDGGLVRSIYLTRENETVNACRKMVFSNVGVPGRIVN